MSNPSPRTSALAVFQFDSLNVRIIDRAGQPWFVAADVCAALELDNATRALERLDEDEQALISNQGIHRGSDPVNVINESGLYSLILGSRKPSAKRFKKWVTSEVLPAIRKTGGYAKPNLPQVRMLGLASRQFHATATAFRKDHGLRLAYQMANAEAIAGSGLDLLAIWNIDLDAVPAAGTPKKRIEDRILDCIGNATRYARDKAYSKPCKAGFMPFGKLAALAQIKVKELKAILIDLEAQGLIVKVDDERTGHAQCYAMAGSAA